MTKWLYVLAAVAVFGAGYAFADALRTADIEQLKADYAAAAQRYQTELTKRRVTMRRSLLMLSTRSKLRLMLWMLSLLACASMLSACATQRPPAVVECPPALVIPESLVSDESKNVSDYLQRVRSFLKKAADWSGGSRQTDKQ